MVEVIWSGSGGYLDGVRSRLEVVWKVSGGCSEGILRVFGIRLGGMWKVS